MNKVTRFVEIPRTGTHKELKARYPGYTVIGDTSGYHWPVEQTKTVIANYGFKTLIEAVKKHMTANDVVIPTDLERQMNELACQDHPENCSELDPDAARKVSLWHLAKRFFTAAISAATTGLVSQEEAERRAAICAVCPHNGGSALNLCGSGCHTAKFVREAAEALSTKHTSLDDKLFTCQLCECSLRLKCHVQKEAMVEKEIEWPPHCWMR